MDVLTFVSQVIDSLAWPVATVAVALIFRHQLRRFPASDLSGLRPVLLSGEHLPKTEVLWRNHDAPVLPDEL